ncbi:MAG: hypothetical protein APF84_13255 [Gracilibacter sp. BRH_c7a]|nr:MAG: hypothetical protein APF84_13255 [Gracilibacter sp. BRH_c7a]
MTSIGLIATKEEREEIINKTKLVIRDYRNFYNSIKEYLPHNVQKISEYDLHDAGITGFKVGNDNTFAITLDRGIKFTFINVQTLTIPNELLGRWWGYDEIYLTDKGFEMHVLLDNLSELFVEAENVLIDEKRV